jgi:hypothetical protein
MNEPQIHRGGCLCGKIAYELDGPALQTTLCHCEDCRRASGAPFVVWTFFKTGTLRWTRGTPKIIHFANRERSFCGDCGTALKFYDPQIPHLFEINTCSLDQPENYPPGDQCWTHDQLPWIGEIKKLPRYPLTSPIPGET